MICMVCLTSKCLLGMGSGAAGTGDGGTAAPQPAPGNGRLVFPFPMPSHFVLGTHLPGSVIKLPRTCQGGKLHPSASGPPSPDCPAATAGLLHSTGPSAWVRPSCSSAEPSSAGLAVFWEAGSWCSPKGSPLLSLASSATDLPGLPREGAASWRNCSPKCGHPRALHCFNALPAKSRSITVVSGQYRALAADLSSHSQRRCSIALNPRHAAWKQLPQHPIHQNHQSSVFVVLTVWEIMPSWIRNHATSYF